MNENSDHIKNNRYSKLVGINKRTPILYFIQHLCGSMLLMDVQILSLKFIEIYFVKKMRDEEKPFDILKRGNFKTRTWHAFCFILDCIISAAKA